LFKVYYEKQKAVAKATFAALSERAQSAEDLAAIESLLKELMDIVGVFEMTGDLRTKLEESIGAKRTALRRKALEAAKQRIAGARDSKELEGITFDVQDLKLRTEFERARRTRMEAWQRRPDAGRDTGGAR
jgi:transcription elongation factor